MSFSVKAVVFDLDGTLLDTLDDLRNAINHALALFGYPPRSREEIRRFVGNGVRNLMQRSLPEPVDDARFEEIFSAFRAFYAQHNMDVTAPYEGVPELLGALKADGVRIAVVSNKNDENVKALCRRFFPDTVELAIGERPGIQRKPAPDTVNEALAAFGVSAQDALYVGDSEVDIETAANAHVPCLAVTWGFRDEDVLRRAGATWLIHRVEDFPGLN